MPLAMLLSLDAVPHAVAEIDEESCGGQNGTSGLNLVPVPQSRITELSKTRDPPQLGTWTKVERAVLGFIQCS